MLNRKQETKILATIVQHVRVPSLSIHGNLNRDINSHLGQRRPVTRLVNCDGVQALISFNIVHPHMHVTAPIEMGPLVEGMEIV